MDVPDNMSFYDSPNKIRKSILKTNKVNVDAVMKIITGNEHNERTAKISLPPKRNTKKIKLLGENT